MKTRVLFVTCAVTCALAAAACGGSDNKTAQDPSTTSTTSASADPTSQNNTASAAVTSSSTSTSQTTATGAAPTSGTTTATDPNANAQQTMAPAQDNPGSANQTNNADNTKINDRDRHGALTPVDQGNSKSETQITASIRKSVIGTKGLSFAAKNVKIITTGTKVTLRGPVSSDSEKATIESLAQQTAGVTMVDDQLEVKK